MALSVIDRITRKGHEVERSLSQRLCGDRECRSIDSCLRNLQRIEHLLSTETYNELKNSLTELRTLATANFQGDEDRQFSVRRVNPGRRGRPTIEVTREQIEFLMNQGHTVKKIARMLGCSSSFLYKKSKLMGIPIRSRLSVIDDDQLQEHVRGLQGTYPNSGNEMMRALLRAQGVIVTRARVREVLTRINPTAAARRWSRTVARRVYHAPYPNSLWHIDGNMRLIQMGLCDTWCNRWTLTTDYLPKLQHRQSGHNSTFSFFESNIFLWTTIKSQIRPWW
ncbi:uncharacterized protein LOC121654513 [Melanotaenia boesemani]|uniref:uncharacterized protein LOC121654513 n=1 Tax=Melanotaenia boesemani TaxID=1250792 RepID=UPI001C048A7C|nr:uncharacterized protein LOC121654513 [Melanotaenia boesemani]